MEFDTAIKLTTPQMETMLALHRGEDVSVTASDDGELEGCVHVDPASGRIGTLIDPEGRGLGIYLSSVKGSSEGVKVTPKTDADDLLQTLRAIGNGAGTAGDLETYPEYIMQMCRRVVEEYEQA